MTERLKFETPRLGQFSLDWQGKQEGARFMLEQADGLVEAIQSGKLQGVAAAEELQMFSSCAALDLFTAYWYEEEEVDYDYNKAFWDYALAQAEKAREAFDLIAPPQGREQAKLFKALRTSCDDCVQFFRCVCSQGIEAAVKQDFGDNPFSRGRG